MGLRPIMNISGYKIIRERNVSIMLWKDNYELGVPVIDAA